VIILPTKPDFEVVVFIYTVLSIALHDKKLLWYAKGSEIVAKNRARMVVRAFGENLISHFFSFLSIEFSRFFIFFL
jgi:hypothetical protein